MYGQCKDIYFVKRRFCDRCVVLIWIHSAEDFFFKPFRVSVLWMIEPLEKILAGIFDFYLQLHNR